MEFQINLDLFDWVPKIVFPRLGAAEALTEWPASATIAPTPVSVWQLEEEAPVRPDQGTIERAFDIARSGSCETIGEIRIQLAREGHFFSNAHLEGPAIRKQLTACMRAAKT